MSDLRELYQEVILDHFRHPRNFGEMQEADHQADGYNPLCGDKVTIYLKMDGEVIHDIQFIGSGCAISTASVSIMTEELKGKTVQEADVYFEKFHDLVTGRENRHFMENNFEKLSIFEGVKEFPARVKCAILPWHTLKAALENRHEVVKTE